MAGTIHFLPAHLDLFSRASHDVNPLHMDADYARRTVYGERVVFGVLGALAVLGRGGPRPGFRLSRLILEFPSPVLIGVEYQLELAEAEASAEATLRDGRRVALRVRADWLPLLDQRTAPVFDGVAPNTLATEPADLSASEIHTGLAVSESYAPVAGATTDLIQMLGLEACGITRPQIASILWSSYLVGMRLPGMRALYSRLDLRFEGPGEGHLLETHATVSRVHRHFGRIRIDAQLKAAELFATATIEAFIREDVPVTNLPAIASHLPASLALAGTHALVVGGSRGLGAGLVRALALQGATVWLAYARSDEAAGALQVECAGAGGAVKLLRGDAADPTFWDAVCAQLPRLDLLVLNAFPALLPLWVDGESLARMTSFVHRAWALTATPLAHLGRLLAESEGTLLTVSTSAVERVVAEWPHYVAAKSAAEGLTRVFVAEHPKVHALIVRPSRLWTDLSNTPLGRHNATPVAVVAASLVRRLLRPRSAGVEVIDTFA